MREFVFSLIYESGVNPLMDLFIEHPDARSQALLCGVTDGQLWRIERVVGPESAMDDFQSVYLDEDEDLQTVSGMRCDGQRYHDLLDAGPNRRVFYTYLWEVERCHSIPALANRYLEGGLVFELARQRDEERWRILMPNDSKVGLLYDTLDEKLRDGITFKFGHLDDATGWAEGILTSATIPNEQRLALEEAVDRGYYETPREITLDELSDVLDVPRSTLSYRLRRAESRLAKHFVQNSV
jgi:predicted DNA binding protein